MSDHPTPDRSPVELLDALRRSGGVGPDLADVDWSATPLGHPDGWDHSLRTMVRVVVGSQFAMWMGWGPDLTFFCNDAYRRDTLASKYPWALGRPAREVWEEIWEDIGPRIEGVLATGEATWDESLLLFLERSGYPEETYHTFSYSPLTDDLGQIAGFLCVVTEETDRVIGERRMRSLRDVGAIEGGGRDDRAYLREAAAALEASDRSLPFKIIYLIDSDGIARLAGTSGISADHPAAPAEIDPADPDAPWPMADVLGGELVKVEDIRERFPDLPAGAWSEPPHTAAIVPLLSQVAGNPPVGFLIAGANQYRPFDGTYRSFLELLAAQLASGVASARSFEAERERAEDLARLDTAKTTFFTNVSHELRTPLTLLLAPAEDMLASGVERPVGERQRLELILGNGQRLLRLVNTLLDFSRLESGQTQLAREEIDLSSYTLELLSMFESAVSRADLTLRLDCPPLGTPVWVDREMWAKIVLNLVSNALKFTLRGTITVSLHPLGADQVRLAVSDTGIGISEPDQARLFERFQRVEGTSGRTHEGTGIGLALVAELAAAHGGHCTVTSRLGEGSTFGVDLPTGSAQRTADQLALDQPPSEASEAGGADGVDGANGADEAALHERVERVTDGYLAEISGWLPAGDADAERATTMPVDPSAARILVVDDNADMRSYVRALLGDLYAVQTANDGVEGFEAALADQPDLILTDVMMPRMDGFGLLDALRADTRTMHIPVVMLSARAGEEGMLEGLEAGADDYLIKPFTSRELTARVAANLELDRARRVRDRLERGQRMQDQAERLAQVGAWEIDFATTTIHMSEQFKVLVGPNASDFANLDLRQAILNFADARDIPAIDAIVDAAMESGQPFQYKMRDARNENRWMMVRAEMIFSESGERLGLRGLMQDITSQRLAEQAMAAAAAAQQVAEREHAIADELQRSLLPGDDLSNSRLEVASFYRTGVEGTRAGGDFYDVIDLGVRRTAIVIGDVSGRGVRAASLMGQLRAAIHAHARLDLPPADVLEQLDTMVLELGHGSLVTCIYGIHDADEGTFVYASAGHLPPVLVDPAAGSAMQLPSPTGPPLGAGGMVYTEQTAAFAFGATLVLYTDGLVERRRAPIDINLHELADVAVMYEGPVAQLPETLVTALGARDIDDDVAILAVRSAGEAWARLAEHEIAPFATEVRKARRFTALTLEDWGIGGIIAQDATIIVSELVTNAIVYGRPPVRLRLRSNGEELVIEVEDALAALPRRSNPDISALGGRGLRIVSQLAHSWNARAKGSGKTVWCSMVLPGSRV